MGGSISNPIADIPFVNQIPLIGSNNPVANIPIVNKIPIIGSKTPLAPMTSILPLGGRQIYDHTPVDPIKKITKNLPIPTLLRPPFVDLDPPFNLPQVLNTGKNLTNLKQVKDDLKASNLLPSTLDISNFPTPNILSSLPLKDVSNFFGTIASTPTSAINTAVNGASNIINGSTSALNTVATGTSSALNTVASTPGNIASQATGLLSSITNSAFFPIYIIGGAYIAFEILNKK